MKVKVRKGIKTFILLALRLLDYEQNSQLQLFCPVLRSLLFKTITYWQIRKINRRIEDEISNGNLECYVFNDVIVFKGLADGHLVN